jgi:hypothetical protein
MLKKVKTKIMFSIRCHKILKIRPVCTGTKALDLYVKFCRFFPMSPQEFSLFLQNRVTTPSEIWRNLTCVYVNLTFGCKHIFFCVHISNRDIITNIQSE